MLHAACIFILILSTVPMLWPEIADERIISICGYIFISSFGISLFSAIYFVTYDLLHLRNKHAILRITNTLGFWLLAAGVTVFLTYRAKVPMDRALVEKAPTLDIKVNDANEILKGASSLVIQLRLSDEIRNQIQESPNLAQLEAEHPDIIKHYLQQSPRWSSDASDTFYVQLGHVEIILKDQDNNPRGVVHAAFRTIAGGEEMPHGYVLVKAGDELPTNLNDTEQSIPDLILDLGGDYFLLIAWRGIDDRNLALQCINNSIRYIDASFDTLVKKPTIAQIDKLIKDKQSFTLTQPRLKLSEPPSQYGTYQAEIYANPQEMGQLLLLIKDSKTSQVLRVISCYAQYSNKEDEYFLHEIPADLPNWLGRQAWAPGKLVLESGIPLFTIKRDKSGNTFEADFEVWFIPSDITKEKQQLLTKRYRVHPCDYIADTKLQADEESDIKISTQQEESTLEQAQESPTPQP